MGGYASATVPGSRVPVPRRSRQNFGIGLFLGVLSEPASESAQGYVGVGAGEDCQAKRDQVKGREGRQWKEEVGDGQGQEGTDLSLGLEATSADGVPGSKLRGERRSTTRRGRGFKRLTVTAILYAQPWVGCRVRRLTWSPEEISGQLDVEQRRRNIDTHTMKFHLPW